MTLRSAIIAGALAGSSSGDTLNLEDSAATVPPELLSDLDDDDINSPDGLAWSPVVATLATRTRLGFPTPTTPMFGAQQFKANLFVTAGSPTTAAKGKLILYEAGTPVSPEVSVEEDITATGGEVITLDFDASDLADPTGADVEVRFDGTPGHSSGTPINAVGINSVRWEVQRE